MSALIVVRRILGPVQHLHRQHGHSLANFVMLTANDATDRISRRDRRLLFFLLDLRCGRRCRCCDCLLLLAN